MLNAPKVQHPAIEELVDVLCARTGNNDRKFFRVLAAYFLTTMASSMRATLRTEDRGDLPVNTYALALSPSGSGKGHSVNILEEMFMKDFRHIFREETLPLLAEQNMAKMASTRAIRNGTEENDEYAGLDKEYQDTGGFLFSFDSGTTAAMRQIRQKMLLAGAGSLNLQIDEIGMNLAANLEPLTLYLELYDKGLVKNKLLKNSAENKRTQEVEGITPANGLFFGAPSKLLDGGQAEDLFFTLLETGYARRCLFAMGSPEPAYEDMTPEEIYDRRISPKNSAIIDKWARHFANLAHPDKHNWILEVQRDQAIRLVTYQNHCMKASEQLPENDVIRKAEIDHRYFKALKLAGALAFVDEVNTVMDAHLDAAITLVEESGAAFQALLQRERAYMKLARYIADVGSEVTHSDLLEALPFYKSGQAARNEMISMASAWGFKQKIMIKKAFVDGIEFFSGETLRETSLDEIRISYSDDIAYNYRPEEVPFADLHKLTQAPGMHWANHWFDHGHRADDNVQVGFNLMVIDVDGGVALETVHDLLKDYTFMTYTTKRHTAQEHRFRLLMPISYEMKLDKEDFREFMANFRQWLPFETDAASEQRSKKWLSNSTGAYHTNITEKLIDPLPFVPKTKKNEQYKERSKELKDYNNLERWFAERIAMGNRNDQMLRFAMALVDSGMSYSDVEQSVISFNAKLSDSLDVDELQRTVLVTVAKKLQSTP